MSRRAKSELTYLAPGANQTAGAGTAKVWLPGAWPAPDDHIVEPESGHEMIDGRVMEVTPADAPHADKQCDLVYVLRAHVAPGYVASTELLTRVSKQNNFATDACIRRDGFDAKGHRHLEELSFEVQHTQSEANLNKRARYLRERGVRRVIAIEVNVAGKAQVKAGRVQAGPVKEWVPTSPGSHEIVGHWRHFAEDELFEDPCLQRPVKIAALMDAVEADNAVARALMARQNPAIVDMRQQSFDEGHAQGFDKGQLRGEAVGNRRAIVAVCKLLGIALTSARQAKLSTLNSDESLRLLTYLETNKNWDESLD